MNKIKQISAEFIEENTNFLELISEIKQHFSSDVMFKSIVFYPSHWMPLVLSGLY